MPTPSLTDIRDNVAKVQSDLTAHIAAQSPVPSRPVIRVLAGENLAAKVNDGLPDTIYELPVDFTFHGDIVFSKPCTVTHASPSTLPSSRVTLSTPLPTLYGQFNTMAPVTFVGIRMEGTNHDRKVVETYGNGTGFDRCVIQGGPDGSRSGLYVSSDDGYATRCHIGNHWYLGREVQAVGAVANAHRWVIDDCFLEGSGENFMLGGDDIGGIESKMCTDWVVTHSHLFKPLAWAAYIDPANPNSEMRVTTVKNLFELKAVKRFRMDDCILENCWPNAQSGLSFVLTVRNQNGNDPFATVQDAEFNGITIINAGGISILGRDDSNVSERMARITLRYFSIQQNGGRTLQIMGGPKDVTIDGLNVMGSADRFLEIGNAVSEGVPRPDSVINGLTVRNSYFLEGEYGIHGDGSPALGKAVLDMYAPGCVWTDNTVKLGGQRYINYPDGTTRVF